MDVYNLKMGIDVDCKKPRLVHTSETLTHNGHRTLNLSYQIVLQDHNYGAPPPTNINEPGLSCKQEQGESKQSANVLTTPVSSSQRSGLKTFTPLTGRGAKLNGHTPTLGKRPASASIGNGVGYLGDNTPSTVNTPKSQTPPLLPKTALNFPCVGDLNSHLYASVATEMKDDLKANAAGNGSGLSGFLGGWFRNGERARSRSDLVDSFNDDSNESIENSPRMATESDHEGEETETAPECEGEDDYDERNHEESVTRCICKFGHDDGYMICCDRCSVWQHVDCMNLDRNNIPDEYLCELCQPRRVDRARARAVQYRKRQEFRLTTPPPTGLARRDRINKESYVDVEKSSPKKFNNRSYNAGPKYSGRGGSTTKNSSRNEPIKTSKRGRHKKWKRKGETNDDVDSRERISRKRKIFRPKNDETIDVGGPSSTTMENSPQGKVSTGELLLQWIDHYEEAVTNHYSPELRARIPSVRPNGLSSELLSLSSVCPSFRLASKAGGFKTLVASCPIKTGKPVIEYRGKYMLASQLRPYKSGDSCGGGLRPTPHIIYHQLLTASGAESTNPASVVEMCVDGRSYGNEARFVWQSCQPNAEVRHKVEKGSVHLYLVAKTEILDSEEITVSHDLKNALPCPYEGCPHMKNRDGSRTGLASTNLPNVSPVETDRRRRRRRTNSTAAAETTSSPTPVQIANVPSPTISTVPVTPPTPAAPPPTPIKRVQRTPSKLVQPPVLDTGEDSLDGSSNLDDSNGYAPTEQEFPSSKDKRKMSREERKMEAIMKAFERMEKAQQRRQESIAKTAHRKDSRDGKEDGNTSGGDVEMDVSSSPPHTSVQQEKKSGIITQDGRSKTFRRGKRGGRLRRSSGGSGMMENSRIRMRALSGEVHSGHSATEEESEHGGNSSSPGQGNAGNPVDDNLAVQAFKCPKTKKVVFNDWSGESGDMNGTSKMHDPSDQSGSNPLSLSLPMCYMRNPNPRSPTRPIRTVHMRPSSLASFKCPTGGSGSPDPHDANHSLDENLWAAPLPGSAGGSAKKRWLRQAISEETETESPTSNNLLSINSNSSEVLDHVTPLKKRRLARASLSSETSFTPPSTPTPTTQVIGLGETNSCESMVIDKEESNAEMISAENSQGTPPECDYADIEKPLEEPVSAISFMNPLNSLDEKKQISLNTPATPSSGFTSESVDESFKPSGTRPIWEFRAPDAQFMRTRNVNEVSDTWSDPPKPPTSGEEQPKPVKRKLSILEYRQRKQTVCSDANDAQKGENNFSLIESPPPKCCPPADSTLADGTDSGHTSTKDNLLSRSEVTTLDESNTDLSTDGDS